MGKPHTAHGVNSSKKHISGAILKKCKKTSFPWNSISVKNPLPVRSSAASEEFFKSRLVTPWIEKLIRDDPSKLQPVPGYEFWDLQRVGNLEGWRLYFSPDIIIKQGFWKDLLCMNYGSIYNGWLDDQHISMWVDYLNETRPRDADWCMVDSWFVPLLMRGDLSHLYGDGSRFKVSWGEVRRVFIPINNARKHWNLGEFDVATGVITIYDSLHGALQKDEDKTWVFDMMEKVKAKLPSYLEGLGVFEKKGIASCLYNIRFEIFPQNLTPQ